MLTISAIGLGKMGRNLSLCLLDDGYRVVGFDVEAYARARLVGEGAETVASPAPATWS
jgi:6-phosphogluconate dehydrogenase (decarboxylating)